jgi:hypothetical protein
MSPVKRGKVLPASWREGSAPICRIQNFWFRTYHGRTHRPSRKNPDLAHIADLCPFGAIEVNANRVSISPACRMCKLCIKKGPPGAFELVDSRRVSIDKSAWRGVAVYIDQTEGEIHPVSLELVGKACELAGKIGQPVYALLAGHRLAALTEELRHYGIDTITVYDHPQLEHFRSEPYTAVLEDFINRCKPSTVLVGGTAIGRSLAPRVAARFRTGLTADCTFLDMQPNTDLDQIRPAFGGNIMAHIRTPRHRQQFATVRYKIFSAPQRRAEPDGDVIAVTRATPCWPQIETCRPTAKSRSRTSKTPMCWSWRAKGSSGARILICYNSSPTVWAAWWAEPVRSSKPAGWNRAARSGSADAQSNPS